MSLPPRAKPIKVVGLDPGRNYVAWAVVRGTYDDGFSLYRHGMIELGDIGTTATFGSSLGLWGWFFELFVRRDLRPCAVGIERFTYRPGSTGQISEEVSLHIGRILGPGVYAVRNTDWKGWAKRNLGVTELLSEYFHTPSEHEADAAGIALYTASVVLPRQQKASTPGFGAPYLC